ncbi:MAG: 3-hydroxyacyl-CoA dehydrogenase NAD-binding domain-containing protein, partial [Pseudomonadota bacterium]
MPLSSDSTVAVCGAGSMGAGIAQVASAAGHHVIVLDRDEAALERGRATVAKGADALLSRGKIDAAAADALQSRIHWTLEAGDLKPAALVIEAIIENADVKRDLFAALEGVVEADAILATNTSTLSVTELAAKLKRPGRFLGLHFFNPAPVMKLVEVVSGVNTDAAAAEASLELMLTWGKKAVFARDVPGFIVNRVARPFYSEGWRAFEEQAMEPASLDHLYKACAGFRMGPMELGDLIGHDINWIASKSVFDAYHGRTRFRPSLAQGALVAAERLGRKTGAGVYEYGEGAEKPEPSFAPEAASKARDLRFGPAAAALSAMAGAAPGEAVLDGLPSDAASIDGAALLMARGKSAWAEAAALGRPVALIDWVRSPAETAVFGYAASDDTADAAARAFAARCGKR